MIEIARNLLSLTEANSTEFDPKAKHPIINVMEEQKFVTQKGGTMRLGNYLCDIKNKTMVLDAYGKNQVTERHRHRYEFNNKYKKDLEAKSVIFSGCNKERDLVEIFELTGHPWFVGCQFHPELVSKPMAAHPLFVGFIKKARKHQKTK